MVFGTLNSILSTAVSITYTFCYAIVLMFYNNRINVISLHNINKLKTIY